MSIQDPTIKAIATYSMSPFEALVGGMILAITIIIEVIQKGTKSLAPTLEEEEENIPISYQVIRTPKSAFKDVSVEEGDYLYVNYKGQNFRVHYLDVGPPSYLNTQCSKKYEKLQLHTISLLDNAPNYLVVGTLFQYSSDKVILCLHGEPFWSQSYSRLIPYLVGKGYRVVAPDFVGFGRSDKLLDWRAYSLGLHEAVIVQLIKQLNLNHITLVGHNWGFLAGVHVLRKYPEWFDNLVILNTNNLPDGEVDRTRFPRLKHYPSWGFYLKYLLYDSYFLVFASAMRWLKYSFPLALMLGALNPNYILSTEEKTNFMAPFKRREDFGGVVAFPLMVPVKPSDKYVEDFRNARLFLGKFPKTVFEILQKSHI